MLKIAFKHFFISVFLSTVFSWPKTSFADSPPNLISPSDNSTVSKSTKLNWEYSGECVSSGSCFLVEIDNDANFDSTEKSSYTNNLTYSPQGLAEGIWNWRVKAKGKDEKWSDWSKVFKFTISSSSPVLNTALSSPESKPETKSEEKLNNDFTIKDIPSEINSDQEFEVSVLLKLPDKPNSQFYLKGAFKKDDSSNYFGQTLSSEWTRNSSKYSNQFKLNTNSEGIWEGKIKVKPDSDDSGFTGTGDYLFKTARYTDSGSGPTWSNQISIKINAISVPEPLVSEEIEHSTEEAEEINLAGSIITEEKNYEIKIASVAGVAISSDNTHSTESVVLGEKNVNWFLISSGLAVFLAGFIFVFLKIKKGKINAEGLH